MAGGSEQRTIEQRSRGDGTTTRQMEASPKGAIYVWCNGQLDYPRRLAEKIGRNDLHIVGPYWLEAGGWHGLVLSGLTVDHAARLSERELEALSGAETRVR